MFPIPIFIIRSGSETEVSKPSLDPKVAKRLHEDYRTLIRDYFSKHNLHEWTGQMSSDPWSPGLHYICKTEQRKFLKLIPYSQEVAVAEIESEPQFSEQNMDTPNLRYDGLEARVIDRDFKPIVEEFCKQYKQKFNEPTKIV